MTGKRTYRNSLSNEKAINELLKGKGMQFDSNLDYSL
jgi:HD-GYP domain-containing protein (c-di-GMP phosphodiesterase class II)